jgi:hypothetical protein
MPDTVASAPPDKFIDGYTLWLERGITQDRFRRACGSGELPSRRQGHSHNSKLIARAEDIRIWLAGLPKGTDHIARPVHAKE